MRNGVKDIERVGDRERQYVAEVLDGQYRASSGGKFMRRLEQAVCQRYGVKFAITHNSGTSTLHSCLAAVGTGEGDEVIVPPLTMASTSLAVLHCRARPVFADVDRHTFTIDPAAVEQAITGRTRAIIVVALYG
ncbi:MAG: DegT/DnrJ/EryC1/StrS family aminotransferase, partial [Negativicutes bacterium]|nr:DegT/DnrJ/EryC1/StrS family aminotransferase [Negativicutes bacterium]